MLNKNVEKPVALAREELLNVLTWYKVTKQELNYVLTGVSIGLKCQGITDANLELAITSQMPEIFLGKEIKYVTEEIGQRPDCEVS